MQLKPGTQKKWRWLHNYTRLERCEQSRSHTLIRFNFERRLLKSEGLLTVIHLSGLLRRSAVVRGAVDTGGRRNHKVQQVNSTAFIVQNEIQEKLKMRKLNLLLFAVAGILMSSMSVFAQADTAAHVDNNVGLKALAAGIGFAIAVFGGAIGQSRIGAAACEGAARNPGAAGRIQTMMILGLALIESLVLFALVIVFIKT